MGDDDATRDMFMVRAQQVRAAVAALGEALDGDGQTYLKNVKKWARLEAARRNCWIRAPCRLDRLLCTPRRSPCAAWTCEAC